jgi:hypothetical protein
MLYIAHMYWKFSQIFVKKLKTLSPVVGKCIQDVCDGQVLVAAVQRLIEFVRAPPTTQLEAAYRENIYQLFRGVAQYYV